MKQLSPATATWGRAVGVAALLSLLVVRVPGSGYILSVDAGFGPRAPLPGAGYGAPLGLLQAALTHLIGGGPTGRVFAGAALFVAALGPMILLRRLPWYAQLGAGSLGALNPWTYEHLAEGQWAVVAAAGLLFVWLAAWETLLRRPGPWPAVRLVVAGLAVVACSANFVGILAILALAAVLESKPWRHALQRLWSGAALGASMVILMAGALPFFVGSDPGSYSTVRAFGRADFATFATTPDPTFGLFDVVGLYGHWSERIGRYPPATGGVGWWPATVVVLVGLALAGAALRPQRRWLLVPGALGILLALSTATGVGLDLATSLAQRIPLIGAYREPGKFAALWLLSLVVLAAEGVAAIAGRFHGQRREVVAAATSLAMAVATLLPAGYNEIRQLPASVVASEYPGDWTAAATWMEAHVPATAEVAVLPWHKYEAFPFTDGRLVGNPAAYFFPGRLLVPEDAQVPGDADAAGPHGIGAPALLTTDPTCALAAALRGGGVRYALVESGPEDAQTPAEHLLGCGFTVAEGAPGKAMVLVDGGA